MEKEQPGTRRKPREHCVPEPRKDVPSGRKLFKSDVEKIRCTLGLATMRLSCDLSRIVPLEWWGGRRIKKWRVGGTGGLAVEKEVWELEDGVGLRCFRMGIFEQLEADGRELVGREGLPVQKRGE